MNTTCRPTSIDVDELRRLYFGGLSTKAISDRLGRDRRLIAYHLRRDPRYFAERDRRAREGSPLSGGRSGGRYGWKGSAVA